MKELCCHSQKKAIKAYESLSKVLKTDHSDYPACFAGSYINEENQLVVNVSGEDAESFKREISYKLKGHDFTLQKVTYSYQQLKKIAGGIFETVVNGVKNTAWLKDVNFWYIDVANNRIVVYIKGMNEEKITKFKSGISDFPAIEFRSSGMTPREDLGEFKSDWEYPSDEYLQIHPGQGIMTNRGLATMTCRTVRYNPLEWIGEGFLTAASAVDFGSKVYIGDTEVALVVAKFQGLSASTAFCRQVDYSTYPTNWLEGDRNKELELEPEDPIIGEVVNKLGAGSGLTTGTVISFDGYVVSDDVHISGMTVNSFNTEPGDSGALIYRYDSETNTRTMVGLNFGKATDDPALSLSTNGIGAVKWSASDRY